MVILNRNVKSTTVLSALLAHSADSFLDFAVPLVSLTLISLALCTILNLKPSNNKGVFNNKSTLRYLPLLRSNALGNFTAVNSIVHEENFKIFLVGDEELLESIWQQVTSQVILLASDLWHFLRTLHSSTGEAINTTDRSVMVRLQNKKL